jgi:ankyrin repeat protein
LKSLDAIAESAKHVQAATEGLEKLFLPTSPLEIPPQIRKLTELRHATAQGLLSGLREAEDLGDRADAAGETFVAEIVYTRVLEIYRKQNPIVPSIRRLCAKMVKLYQRTDQPFRAEKYLPDPFELPHPAVKTQVSKEDIWKNFCISLSKTSGIISHALRYQYTDFDSRMNLETPFPPLHRILVGDHMSNESPESFCSDASSDISTSTSIQNAVTGGAKNVAEIIQTISDTDLSTRDILLRTPLFFAAVLKREDAGRALLSRIAALDSVYRSAHMNVRDISGQTVLGVAILSGCSLEFVRALIESGANPKPDQLMENVLTPLQAAHSAGRAEIVDLLLEHGANANQYDSEPPQLAHSFGNQTIMQLQSEDSQSSLLVGDSQSNQYQSFDKENSSDTDFSFGSISPPDNETRSPPQGFSYPPPPW